MRFSNLFSVTLLAACATAVLPGCPKDNPPAPGGKPSTSPSGSTSAPVASVKPSGSGSGPVAKPQPKKVSAEDQKKFAAVLEKGRQLSKKSDWKGAITAFQDALKIFPNDARALDELGWAAFNDKNLDLAEKSLHKALRYTADSKIEATILYNLGRVDEERGKKDDAIADYKASLKLRPNKTVEGRLAALQPESKDRSAFTPSAMHGSFPLLEKMCDAIKDDVAEEDKPTFACKVGSNLDEFEGPQMASPVESPYLAAKIIESCAGAMVMAGDCSSGQADFHLAVQTKGGWFLADGIASVWNPGAFGVSGQIHIDELTTKDLFADGTNEVLLRFTVFHVDSDMGYNEIANTDEHYAIVCGVGTSGSPSCTLPVLLGVHDKRELLQPDADEPGMKHDLFDREWAFSSAFDKAGWTIAKSGDGKVPEEHASSVGVHVLKFP